MLEDPDAGRLLLLRVWLTGPHHGPRQEVRHYRPPDDTRYTVFKTCVEVEVSKDAY